MGDGSNAFPSMDTRGVPFGDASGEGEGEGLPDPKPDRDVLPSGEVTGPVPVPPEDSRGLLRPLFPEAAASGDAVLLEPFNIETAFWTLRSKDEESSDGRRLKSLRDASPAAIRVSCCSPADPITLITPSPPLTNASGGCAMAVNGEWKAVQEDPERGVTLMEDSFPSWGDTGYWTEEE